MSLEREDSFPSWVAHAGDRKEASTSQQSPGQGGVRVGWGEGLGFNSFNSGQSQGQREPPKPSDPLEGCPSWEEVVRERVPFPRAPKGKPHLYPPLSTLSHGRRLTPAWTRRSLQFWPPLRGPLGPLQNSIPAIPEVTASSPHP